MNAWCLLLRHRWRVEDIDGEAYEVCARCRHYRNDVDWRDINAGKPRIPPAGGGDMTSGPPAM
jgi:hypothetical protein